MTAGVLQAAAATAMMSARPPQLLACSLTAETVENRSAGGGGVGGTGSSKEEGREKRVDAFRGIAGGRGRESKRAREPYLLLMLVWCIEKEI